MKERPGSKEAAAGSAPIRADAQRYDSPDVLPHIRPRTLSPLPGGMKGSRAGVLRRWEASVHAQALAVYFLAQSAEQTLVLTFLGGAWWWAEL